GTVNQESYIKSAFIAPMQSAITSDFGKSRVYNDSLKGYHSGTDYRAAVGSAIIASNDGIVALVADRFYSGGTVLLDHGQGIYTCYFHMSRFDVKKGQKIKKAQQLGLSGASGRVTGPHLHFAVRINKVQVDPLQFIELMNNKILKEI
ncbi:MAG: M23 family metallopeptidase, partial [Sulfurimonas sp.]|nr:M23 family metallopeptidase [Sulfurimonas sp.]